MFLVDESQALGGEAMTESEATKIAEEELQTDELDLASMIQS